MPDNLATAAYWAPVLETVADVAFAVVILALAVELISGRIARRFERQLDNAREMRLAELQAVSPRILLPSRQKDMIEALSKFSGQAVTVGTTTPFGGVAEISSLGAQIFGVLKAAGWKVGGGPVTWGSDGRPADVVVSTEEGDTKSKEAALALVRELENSSIKATFRPGAPMPPGPEGPIKAPGIVVLIGAKP